MPKDQPELGRQCKRPWIDTESFPRSFLVFVIRKTGMGGGKVWDVQRKILMAANLAPG